MNEMCRTVSIYAPYFKGSIMNTGRKLENVLAICFILYTFNTLFIYYFIYLFIYYFIYFTVIPIFCRRYQIWSLLFRHMESHISQQCFDS